MRTRTRRPAGTRRSARTRTRRALALLLLTTTAAGAAVAAGAATPASAGTGGPAVSAFGSMQLLLPRGRTSGSTAVRLTAAKGETESFQVQVSAGGSGLPGVRVALGEALRGPGGAALPSSAVRLYREDYYRLTTMTDGELAGPFPRDAAGTCQGDCRVPDALVPERDLLTGEDRAAFPVRVPARESRVAWVDVAVPASAATGTYTGSVVVTSGTAVLATVPVALEVLPVAIPATSTMTSQVFVGSRDVGGSWATYRQLAELGLANRLSLVPDGFDPVAGEAVLGPLLAGTDPVVPGARLTTLPLTRWADLPRWHAVLGRLGAASTARFWCDEVDTATCSGWYDTALAAWPGLPLQQIPKYGTATTDPAYLDRRTTTAVPVTTGLDGRLGALQAWRDAVPGRELWTYTSCMQGGCTAPYQDAPLWRGTPGLGIDQPTSQSRATGWLGFTAGLTGEHYWTAVGAYARSWHACTGVQPTDCEYTAAGEATGVNGDGNLFSAWDPVRVGGTTPVPVETLRLKRFRDGREDGELLRLLDRSGHGDQARAVARGLFPSFADTTRTAAQVATARGQVDALVRQVFGA